MGGEGGKAIGHRQDKGTQQNCLRSRLLEALRPDLLDPPAAPAYYNLQWEKACSIVVHMSGMKGIPLLGHFARPACKFSSVVTLLRTKANALRSAMSNSNFHQFYRYGDKKASVDLKLAASTASSQPSWSTMIIFMDPFGLTSSQKHRLSNKR